MLVEDMTKQAANRLNECLVPIHTKVEQQEQLQHVGEGIHAFRRSDGITELTRQEFEKGVRVGVLMVIDYPRATLEFYEDEIRRLKEMLSDEENDDGGS